MEDKIKSILINSKNTVILGASSNQNKDSYKVMKYLKERVFKVLPINSKTSDTMILGDQVYKNID